MPTSRHDGMSSCGQVVVPRQVVWPFTREALTEGSVRPGWRSPALHDPAPQTICIRRDV